MVFLAPLFSAAPLHASDSQITSAQPVPTWDTQKKSRVYEFKIPAPRGIITDRSGFPIASSRVGWDLCISPSYHPLSRVREHVGGKWLIPLPEEEDVSPERIREMLSARPGSAYSSPRYYREYPSGNLASHLLGYVGRLAPLSTGPAENGSMFFTEEEGREGLEQVFDSVLRGDHGTMSAAVDSSMQSVHRRISKQPIPGKNVITTLDAKLQRGLESTLSSIAKRTTAVLIDPATGDILAAASFPNFSPAQMSPYGSESLFEQIASDPSAPLLPRHFRSAYPPASAFKPFVAIAALCSGSVSPTEKLGCPASLKVGNIVFNNWTSSDSGSMDVSRALAVSCNTWFYSAGIKTGAAAILRVAAEFGFGTPPGVVFPSATAGLLPDDEYMVKKHGRKILQGDTANISIGQGDLLVSPLQMAMAYAAVANGGTLWRPRLVMQVQEIDNSVIASYPPRARRKIGIPESFRNAIVKGLEMAVESGTAKSASVRKMKVAGKTGTAQWGPSRENKRLAWFGGFAPSSSPKIAFAFLVEGLPGESIAGADAAALAGRVLRAARADGFFDTEETESKSPPGDPATSAKETGVEEVEVRRAVPVEENILPAAAAEQESTTPNPGDDTPVQIRAEEVKEIYEVPQVDLMPLLESTGQ